MKPSRQAALVLGAALCLGAGLARAFVLWLPEPTRDNPHDPRSPRYSPPGLPGPSPSSTPGFAWSPSPTPSPTASSSPTPAASATPTPGRELLADFENSSRDSATLWGGGVVSGLDPNGSSQYPSPWAASAPGAGGAGHCGRLSGTVAVSLAACPSCYTWSFLSLELLPGGTQEPGGTYTSVTPSCANGGVHFDYKLGTPGVVYQLALVSPLVWDYGHYSVTFTAQDTLWHGLDVYFPAVATSGLRFSKPAWGQGAFDPASIGALQFSPLPSTATAVVYDLSVDNVGFNAPPPPSPAASPTPSANPVLMDFEDHAGDAQTRWGGAVVQGVDNLGSTVTPRPWADASGSAPGAWGASGWCGRFYGHLAQSQLYCPSCYTYSYLAFELVAGGAGLRGPAASVAAASPNSGLQFDYKAGAAGVTYVVELITPEVGDYGYYQAQFTSADTQWHSLAVYFPGVSTAALKFAQPAWAAPVALDPAQVGAVQFMPQALTYTAVDYDLSLDNLTFAAPPAP